MIMLLSFHRKVTTVKRKSFKKAHEKITQFFAFPILVVLFCQIASGIAFSWALSSPK